MNERKKYTKQQKQTKITFQIKEHTHSKERKKEKKEGEMIKKTITKQSEQL